MAVWMNVFGKNGLGRCDPGKVSDYLAVLNDVDLDTIKVLDSLKDAGYIRPWAKIYFEGNREKMLLRFNNMSSEEYRLYLDSMGKPYLLPEKLIEVWIEEGERREADRLFEFNNAYARAESRERPLWQVHSYDAESISFYNCIFLSDRYDGLRVSLFSDIVCMSGPMLLFSKMSHFSNMSRELGAYYHDFFKRILCVFKSDYLLYAHEWSGLYIDDEISNLTSDDLLSKVSKSEQAPPQSMYDLDGWFIEKW